MSNLVPSVRQVRRADGSVYQAVRHVRAGDDGAGRGKGWVPPQVAVGGDQLAYANIHGALSRRGYSDENIAAAIDTAINRVGMRPVQLTATKIMAALNECADALGESDNYAAEDEQTRIAAERVMIASLHQLPSGERVRALIKDPAIDLDRLIGLIRDENVTDPVKLEAALTGTPTSLLDGIL